MRFTQYGSRGL